MDLTVAYQTLNFGITLPGIFGNNVNHLLNIFGALQTGLTLSDETGVFYLGEQYALGGRTVEMVGSGFAQPGISILSLIIPTGLPVDVMIMRDVDTGQYLFVYPNGAPNILSAIALVTNTAAEPYSADFAGAPPVCFCTGTRVAVPGGERPVERLTAGDRVIGADGRVHQVIWSGGKLHPALAPGLRPVVFAPGSLGPGLPARELRLSPQHRLVLAGQPPPHGLAPAKAFVGLPGVVQAAADEPVGYHHLLLRRHAPVLAEGVAVESMLLGDQARAFLGEAALRSIARRLNCDAEALPERPEAQPFGRLLRVGEASRRILKLAGAQGLWAIGRGPFGETAEAPAGLA